MSMSRAFLLFVFFVLSFTNLMAQIDFPESHPLRGLYKELDLKDKPLLKNTFDKITEELYQARKRVVSSPQSYANTYRHYIVDSDELNAFIFQDHKMLREGSLFTSAYYEIRDNVVITRGLLQSFLKSSQSSEEFAILLAGVLAHEFAHPIEGKGRIPKDNWYYRAYKSQKVEILTDTKAIDILAEAGYPEDSLYKALYNIFESSKQIAETGASSGVDEKILNTRKTIDALISSHPEQNVRQSYQRFLLTLRRYNKGLIDSKIERVLNKSQYIEIKKELDIKEVKSLIPKTKIKNLEEAWRRIDNIRKVTKYSEDFKELDVKKELNYTFYWITKYYGKNNSNLSQEEVNRFRLLVFDVMSDTDRFDRLAHKAKIDSSDSDAMKAFKIESATLFNDEFGKGYFDLAQENVLFKDRHFMFKFFVANPYNENRYSKETVKNYAKEINYEIPSTINIDDELGRISTLSDVDKFLERMFKGDMDKYMLRETSTYYIRELFMKYIENKKDNVDLTDIVYYISTLNLEHQSLMLTALKPYLEKNFKQRIKFYWDSFNLSRKLVNPESVNHHHLTTVQYYVKEDKSIRAQKRVYQNFRDKIHDVKSENKTWLHFLWEHRAELALVGMLTGDSAYRMDWGILFQDKALNYEEGMENVRDAIKSYTQTQSYLELLEFIGIGKSSQYENWTNIKQFNRLPWARADLWEYLSGEHNMFISHPKVKDNLKSLFSRAMLFTNPELRNGFIYNDLLSILNSYSRDILIIDFNAEEIRTIQKYYGNDIFQKKVLSIDSSKAKEILERKKRSESYDGNKKYNFDEATKGVNWIVNANQYEIWQLDLEFLWAKAIAKSSYSLEVKKDLLERLLLMERPYWLEKENVLKIRDILLTNGVVKSNAELLSKIERQSFSSRKWISHSNVSVPNNIVFKKFYNDFMKDIDEVKKKKISDDLKYEEYMTFHKKVLSPVQLDEKKHPNVRKIADYIFKSILDLSINEDLKRNAFLEIYNNNPTKLSDQYFVQKMFSKVFSEQWIKKGNHSYWQEYSLWPGFLSHYYVWDRGLLINKVEEYISKILLKGNKKELEDNVLSLTEQMDKEVPYASLQKDRLLEKMAMDLEINDLEVLRKMESYKTYHRLQEIQPKGVNIFSAISQYIDFMNEDQIITVIKFIKSGQASLSTEVKQIFERALKKDIEKSSLIWSQVREGASFESIFEQLVFQIESLLSGIEAKEKMPLYDILFTKGIMPLYKRPDFIDYILEEIVEIKPESINYPYLKSYIESSLEHEKTVILSYIISQNALVGDDPSSIKDIFERHGVVGKKTGQWISLLNIMDEKYSDVLAELKTKAEPLSRYQMYKILDRELGNLAYSEIRSIKSILGSASTKTVVKVELKSGKEIVASIQSDEALLQTKTQIKFFQRFIDRLAVNGVYKLSAFKQELFHLFTANILNELNFEIEQEAIRDFNKVVDKLNNTNEHGSDWRINSVELANELPSSKKLLFTELIPGTPMSEFSKDSEVLLSTESIVGEFLGRLFMEEGYVEADRHRGNQLISMDPNNKVITFLDIAQFKKFNKGLFFTSDTRTRVIGLLNSLHNRDSRNVYYFLNSMSLGGRIEKKQLSVFLEETEKILYSELSEAEMMIQVFELYYEYGGKINSDFLTYFFKSFLTINAERYLDVKALKDQLIEAAKRLVDEKKIYFYFHKSKFINCNGVYLP